MTHPLALDAKADHARLVDGRGSQFRPLVSNRNNAERDSGPPSIFLRSACGSVIRPLKSHRAERSIEIRCWFHEESQKSHRVESDSEIRAERISSTPPIPTFRMR